jgi:hypothetical protein
MKTTTTPTTTVPLHIYTSATEAVRCSCPHGWSTVRVATSEWTPEEREELAQIVRVHNYLVRVGSGRPIPGSPATGPSEGCWRPLDVAPPTAERLHEIVQKIVEADNGERIAKAETKEAEEAREAKEVAEREAEYLAAPVGDLLQISQNIDGREWALKPQYGLRCALRADAQEEVDRRNQELKKVVVQALVETDLSDLVEGTEVANWAHGTVTHCGKHIDYTVGQSSWPSEVLEAAEAAVGADRATCDAERAEWIAAHGSERLQRCHAEEIECGAILRDEWLANERPDCRWYLDVPWSVQDPRNPPMEALDFLHAARKTDPDVNLHYWQKDEERGYCVLFSVRLPGDRLETDLVSLGPIYEDDDDTEDY